MKAIVTGSSGFIGSRLCYFLSQQGHSVVKVSRTAKPNSQTDLICDLEINKLNDGVMSGINTIFHLAGYAHDLSNPEKSRKKYVKLNIEATKNLAIQASKEGVKTFIFVSSVKAGSSDTTRIGSEEKPEGIYGETKRKAELELLKFSKLTDMKIFIIRPSLVYGPEIKGNLLSMKRAIQAGWFPALPKIKNVRSMIHVDDLVRAIFLVKEKGIAGEIYNVTDGKNYSTTEIYETLYTIIKKDPPKLRFPLFVLNLLSFIPGKTSQTISKLVRDERYSSSKIESLGFSAKLRFGDMNETLF
jgi:nucleoside-diphosphate-sugar epimerase